MTPHPSSEPRQPPRTLLGVSVGARLALVAALLTVLWTAVIWSLD